MTMGSIPAEQWGVGASPVSCRGVGRMAGVTTRRWGRQVARGAARGGAAVPLGPAEPGPPQGCASTDSHVTVRPFHLCSVSSSPYDYEISGPLGRENYKEMYLFIYR